MANKCDVPSYENQGAPHLVEVQSDANPLMLALNVLDKRSSIRRLSGIRTRNIGARFSPRVFVIVEQEITLRKSTASKETMEVIICALTGTSPALPRPRAANGAPLTITHEIRQLRSRVAEMEVEVRDLNCKWAAQLLNQRTLAIAQRYEKEKHGVHQTEMAHGELQHMLLEQQLLFASLQAAVLRAPLYSNGQDMFEALHFNTHLGHDGDEREKQLLAHK
ncbi:hypothetical protein PsorP6_014613 [Peronosclerospora sorghi]|uniref:Uncharacterized protein n=1 Tax=Peronosclerospora sorghi TaxID=230839 RepID=A0ACC0VUR1_9STRA|nr:hypothetical protein PsorP6_014613 [Peronosclerospora sorghi]